MWDIVITMSDLEQALQGTHFESGSFYYGQVWSEVGDIGRKVLTALAAEDDRGLPRIELEELLSSDAPHISEILKELRDQRILDFNEDTEQYHFTVPLMCRWIQQER